MNRLPACVRAPDYYQPDGWNKTYRFIALRYIKKKQVPTAEEPEQYQLFDTAEYSYRVFVTDISGGACPV